MFIFTAGDIISGIVLLFLILFPACVAVGDWRKRRKQRNCLHLSVLENPTCEAVCRNCNKNLGFIWVWREKKNIDRCTPKM